MLTAAVVQIPALYGMEAGVCSSVRILHTFLNNNRISTLKYRPMLFQLKRWHTINTLLIQCLLKRDPNSNHYNINS